MTRLRNLLGGLLLLAIGALLPAAGPGSPRVLALLLAVATTLAGLANVAVALGRPAALRERRRRVEDGTLLVLALLGAGLAVTGLRSTDPWTVARGALWALTADLLAWLGATRLRTDVAGREA